MTGLPKYERAFMKSVTVVVATAGRYTDINAEQDTAASRCQRKPAMVSMLHGLSASWTAASSFAIHFPEGPCTQ